MGGQDSSQASVVRQAYAQALQMKSEGVPATVIRETIEKKLIAGGLNAAAASILAENVPGARAFSSVQRAGTRRNVLIGGAGIVAGIMLTFFADAGVVSKNLFYYCGVLGLIIAGMVFFIKALFDYKSDR
ncbi:MAG: hypothetical protein PHO30_01430 [Candidatus Omnitrophica bacterium]|jgi:hypothetical protein|nr:hypothetical protein [Candidatus Omnitrophota bacterium]